MKEKQASILDKQNKQISQTIKKSKYLRVRNIQILIKSKDYVETKVNERL